MSVFWPACWSTSLRYHLPLYRQHQRLAAGGITLARATLTQLVARSAALLAPIHLAQLEHVLDISRVGDGRNADQGRDTRRRASSNPATSGRCTATPTRSASPSVRAAGEQHIEDTLAEHFTGTLVTDGYAAYARYAEARPGVTHAQCWAHTRRGFERALDSDPQAQHALALIGELYKAEAEIREKQREGPDKQADRTRACEPVVRAFWRWCDAQCQRLDLEPSHPLAKAIAYALERRASLEVFLGDPDVPIDTNHLERGLRPIPMGRRNWLFCWSEVGATHVGIIQSLISTCRLHGVDPYTYLVDVLQRVGVHPASRVIELTPRLWKEHFAENPLRSDID